jgi:hypothetical protein
MKIPQQLGKPAPCLYELASGEHRSFAGLSGTVIQVLRGRVWITQEGDLRDHIVPEQAHFGAARAGMLVVGALAEGTRIAVYRVAAETAAAWPDNHVRLGSGFIEAAQRAARREAALAFSRLVCDLWQGLRRWWRDCSAAARQTGIGRGYHG